MIEGLDMRVASVLLPVRYTEHGAEPVGQREPANLRGGSNPLRAFG